ncbi:sulfotransferase family 2 domain-containing protein [Winogradskyella poriferorum]|uniref:sulfotransferase family 2 domain-containing protein n=1 Tax=Winogradskyella poriferorum TaxID=307627 RepID=UPI003D661A19
MISHKHKCIFIHIPKCAGTSIFKFFHPEAKINWKIPNYDILYGWCPDRKIHLQHATSKQLLETNLITEEQWEEYYKFTVVRNPWDRSYSDYLWICKERKIRDSFENYMNRTGDFIEVFNNSEVPEYRGDHLLSQIDFFDLQGSLKLDKILRFESLNVEMNELLSEIGINKKFNSFENVSAKRNSKHYSKFYDKKSRLMVDKTYKKDIDLLGYSYLDKRNLLDKIFNSLS